MTSMIDSGELAEYGADRPECWSPEKRGRALEIVRLLANTDHREWRTKKEIYDGLAEFRPAKL